MCPRCRCLGAQFCGQTAQLSLDFVPLNGDRGAIDGDDRTVGQSRSVVLVYGRQLNIAGGDQVLRDDHRFGVGGDRHAMVDLRVISRPAPAGR